jgi:hypothetical protein
MTPANATPCATRDSVLRLLSGAEVTRLSNVDTVPCLTIGDEYLDLEHIAEGVQTVHQMSRMSVGRALPRSGVDAATWSKILTHLG